MNLPAGRRLIVLVAVLVVIVAGVSGFVIYRNDSSNKSSSISLDTASLVYVNDSSGNKITVNLANSDSFVYLPSSLGGQLVVNHSLKRIVSLIPSVTSTLYAIGAYNHTVVGVDQYSIYPTPPSGVKVIYIEETSFSVEEIASLSPGAVMSTTGYFTPQVINEIVNVLNVPFFIFDPNNMTQIEHQNSELGNLTNTYSNATKVNAWMNANLAILHSDTSKIPGNETSVFYDLGPGSVGLYTAGNNTFINIMFNLDHLRNVVTENGYPDLSASQIENLTPQWIILDQYYNQSSFNQSVHGYLGTINDHAIRIANDSFMNENDFRTIYMLFWLGEKFYPSYISLNNVTSFSSYTGIHLSPSPEEGVNGTA
ncbi:MAG: ABC transporter substrate-binding protein [Candidatus Thermoplasmatota archaeon]|nr:ABC transporter substrate-binding protein [Candidatus Thermoplasmatota archaeon]